MKKTNLPYKALVSTIATSLVVSLCPMCAYAAYGDVSSASDTAQLIDTPDTNTAIGKIRENAIEETDTLDVVSASIDITNDENKCVVYEQSGVMFALNNTDSNPVATVLGIASTYQETNIVVPESIDVDGISYTIANIGSGLEMGGGVL